MSTYPLWHIWNFCPEHLAGTRGLASINAKISVCGHKEGREGWTVITYELSHLDLRGFLLLTFSIRMEGSVAHEYLLSHNHPSTLPSVMSVVSLRFIQRASVFPQVMGEVGRHENCLDYVSKKTVGLPCVHSSCCHQLSKADGILPFASCILSLYCRVWNSPVQPCCRTLASRNGDMRRKRREDCWTLWSLEILSPFVAENHLLYI